MTKREWIAHSIGIFIAGIFIGVVLSCIACLGWGADAEAEELTYRCWAMCQPDSEVMIRSAPGKHAEIVGAAGCGQMMWTDWREKGEWLHLVDLSNETGEGWIYIGYVVFEEPERVDREMTIISKGRVACRKWIDGKRNRWAKNGETVEVFWMTREVAVTNRGFIRTEFLKGN